MDSIATSKKRATERKMVIQLYRENGEGKEEKRKGGRETECVYVHVGVCVCVCVFERGRGRDHTKGSIIMWVDTSKGEEEKKREQTRLYTKET